MELIELVARWGPLIVLAAVLLEQGGLPLPSAPILIVAGAIADSESLRPEKILMAALFACLAADHFWYGIGRRYGRRVLDMVCRLSLSPDTCVSRTDDLFARHGAPLLLVAKFIPAVSAVAIPSAAAMGLTYRKFLLFDAAGAILWAGAYIGIGMIFSREVHRALDWLGVVGSWSAAIVFGLLGVYLAAKIFTRWRLQRLHRLVRISPAEAIELMQRDSELIFVDARSNVERDRDQRRLPRAVAAAGRTVVEVVPQDARGHTIITFCTCPNEASAAMLAEQLLRAGHRRVRVLTGGEAALEALGHFA
jgi:membrane protein DedA with SNARE-associated domain/rhodanese-related sulfurtransferase